MSVFKSIALAASLSVTGALTPAFANECMGLWLERNAIFKQAGYCFGSSLGQGVFGNSGCFTKEPNISSRDKSRVANIKSREKRLGCTAQKKRWSVNSLRNYAASLSSPQQPRAAAPKPRKPACRQQAELYFNISGRLETVHNLQVSAPWYVTVSISGGQAFLYANGSDCIGGDYRYSYTAEVDDLGNNPVRTFSGGMKLGSQTRHCEVSITFYNGQSQLFCQ